MTLREFFNAWIGWSEARNEHLEAIRDFHYGAARFNAGATAFSQEQAKSVSGYKFPWERDFNLGGISVHDKIGSFIRREEHKLKKNGRA